MCNRPVVHLEDRHSAALPSRPAGGQREQLTNPNFIKTEILMGISPTQATPNSKLQGAYMTLQLPGDIKQGCVKLAPLTPLTSAFALLFRCVSSGRQEAEST